MHMCQLGNSVHLHRNVEGGLLTILCFKLWNLGQHQPSWPMLAVFMVFLPDMRAILVLPLVCSVEQVVGCSILLFSLRIFVIIASHNVRIVFIIATVVSFPLLTRSSRLSSTLLGFIRPLVETLS